MWRLQQLLRKIPFQWNLLRQNLRARRLRVRWQALVHRLPRTPEGEALLHIGCGDINARHFINIDARDKPHVHIVTKDLFKLDLIPSGFADLIYMSHVLEHVGHRSVVSVLKEMRRILKPGGVLRISVPDFECILRIYRSNGNDISAIEQPLFGGQDYQFNYHYSAFNHAYLDACLRCAGFGHVRTWDPHHTNYHNFEDWSSREVSWGGKMFPISLNLEGVK